MHAHTQASFSHFTAHSVALSRHSVAARTRSRVFSSNPEAVVSVTRTAHTLTSICSVPAWAQTVHGERDDERKASKRVREEIKRSKSSKGESLLLQRGGRTV